MKNLILSTTTILLTLLAIACTGKDATEDVVDKVLDPNAPLYINVKSNLKSSDVPLRTNLDDLTDEELKALFRKWSEIARERHLTPEEIVDWCEVMEFKNNYYDTPVYRGIPEREKDRENKMFIMTGDKIIKDNKVDDYFIEAYDVIFILPKGDTVAYIPNWVLKEASKKIYKAFEEGEYERVYALFKNAYTAIPINGEEYKILKEQGKN